MNIQLKNYLKKIRNRTKEVKTKTMSSDLYWLPPPTEQKRNDIGYLKYEIGGYFYEGYDGESIDRLGTKEMIPFLKGIIAAGSEEKAKDAQRLIDAINKYGEVQLIISW